MHNYSSSIYLFTGVIIVIPNSGDEGGPRVLVEKATYWR